ncbi:MAG: outer membrane protein assembly factor BamA [Bacteroidetes bacterium]|nr:outer membrane protein assembly factor BamA [Bacteroidota bacterium]
MRLKFLIFLLIFSRFLPTVNAQESTGNPITIDYSSPKEYIIAGITVTGIKYLDNNVLIMLSGLSIGDKVKVPGDKISQAVRKLWEQGLFEDVKISIAQIVGDQLYLNIALKERPRMSKFSFEGIKKSDADNIREKIHLVKGDYVTDNLIMRTSNIIRKYYTDKGYLNADVDIIAKKDSGGSNEVTLNINIQRKGKVKVYNITIHGNKNLTTEQIKGALKKTKEKGMFNPMNDIDKMIWQIAKAIIRIDFNEIANIVEMHAFNNIRIRIFKSAKFINEDYEADKIALITKYNNSGFRDARVIRDSISKNPDNTVSIDIWLDEGPKYHFRSISWVGNTKYPDDILNRILRIKKGDVYDQSALESALTYNPNGTDIRSLYMDDGYLFFDVLPVEVNVEKDSIDIEIRMREGKQAVVNKVTVTGNTKTNDHVALRQVQTRPGQMFSRDKLIRSQRELMQLKYFNAEKLTPDVTPNPDDGTVDINYNVEETSADQIELSGGWGYGRIVGTLGLSFNNFSLRNILKFKTWKPIPSGDGQKLGLRFQTYGQGYYSYSVSFTEPWVGGRKPLALSLSYVHSKYSNGVAKSDTNYAYFKIDGFQIGLGTQLKWPDDYFGLYQAINFNRYETHKYTQIFSFGGGNGLYNSISYLISLTRSSIDQEIYPKVGSVITVSCELTPPYSWFRGDVNYDAMPANVKYRTVEFYKWKVKGAWYLNLIGKLVLTTRAQFGVLGAYNNDIGVTPFNRFFLGGDGLTGYNNMDGRELIGFRGYVNNGLTPNYPNMVGGTVYEKFTFELRYPISLNPSATIYGLTFLEAGHDWLKWRYVNPFDVYRSAGVGIRVFLPMFGLLGLDWGYGIDEVRGIPGINGSQFHFSINSSID